MHRLIRAHRYDLFKLIVAVLLLLLLLILLWKGNSPSPTIPLLLPIGTVLSPSTTAAAIIEPQLSATASPQLSATIPSIPSSSPTLSSQPSSTSMPVPSGTNTSTGESTPTAQGPVSVNVCDAATSRSRLQVGVTGTILHRLNFRSSPGIQNNWLLTNRPGTKVEVVGGPVCLPHYVGAYLWWQIRLPDGQVGWSAEASLLGEFYFMGPSQ